MAVQEWTVFIIIFMVFVFAIGFGLCLKSMCLASSHGSPKVRNQVTMDSYGRILRVTPDPSTRTIPAIYNPNYHAYHTFNNHSLFNTPIHHGGSSWPDSSHCPEPTSGDMASCPPSYDSVMCSVDMGFTNSGGCSGDTGGFSGGDSGGCSAGDSGGGCSGDSGGGCSGD